MARLWDSSEYSDVKIVNNKDVYLLHKAIICTQSGFFRRCLEVNMKVNDPNTRSIAILKSLQEKSEGVIELHEDPHLAHCMLKSLYTGTYSYPDRSSRMQFDVQIYGLALQYDMLKLQNLAKTSFTCNSRDLADVPDANLRFWAPNVHESAQTEDFFKAVELLYENTVQDTDDLRTFAATLAERRLSRLESSNMLDETRAWARRIEEHDELMVDIVFSTAGWLSAASKTKFFGQWYHHGAYIQLVMDEAHVSKKRAIIALKAANGHTAEAIKMALGAF